LPDPAGGDTHAGTYGRTNAKGIPFHKAFEPVHIPNLAKNGKDLRQVFPGRWEIPEGLLHSRAIWTHFHCKAMATKLGGTADFLHSQWYSTST
jgi:hypothetical protein